jgi:phage terminase small subunit
MAGFEIEYYLMSTPVMKRLEVDLERTIDMGSAPSALVGRDAVEVWERFAANPPVWWDYQDLPTVERYCDLVGVYRQIRRVVDRCEQHGLAEFSDMVKALKAVSLEVKGLEYSLGLTPQARAALKMTVTAGTAASEKVKKLQSENQRSSAIPVDEL